MTIPADERPILVGSTWVERAAQHRTAQVTEVSTYSVRLGKLGKFSVRALRQGWQWISDPSNGAH